MAILNHPIHLMYYTGSPYPFLINSSDLQYVQEHSPRCPDQFGVHHGHPEPSHVPNSLSLTLSWWVYDAVPALF
jgi:hypothetical protein